MARTQDLISHCLDKLFNFGLHACSVWHFTFCAHFKSWGWGSGEMAQGLRMLVLFWQSTGVRFPAPMLGRSQIASSGLWDFLKYYKRHFGFWCVNSTRINGIIHCQWKVSLLLAYFSSPLSWILKYWKHSVSRYTKFDQIMGYNELGENLELKLQNVMFIVGAHSDSILCLDSILT